MAREEVPVLEIPNIRSINKDELLPIAQELFDEGVRFVTITAFDRGDKREVLYHFDRNMELLHLQLIMDAAETVPSITPVYFCAFLAENEVKELFGVQIQDIAIDYEGHLLIAENCPATPMLKATPEDNTKTAAPGGVKVVRTRHPKNGESTQIAERES